MKRRPSSLSRMARCPASVKVCDLIGWEGEDSDAAASGNACHKWIANGCAMLRADRWQNELDRQLFAEHMREAGLDGSERWCVFECVEHAQTLVSKYLELAGEDGLEILIEHHVDGQCIGLENGGTVDLLLICPFRFAVAVDWKTGRVDQGRAANHDQLRGYATMVAQDFRLNNVFSHLFQPRVDEDEGDRASSAKFDAKALQAAAAWGNVVVQRTYADNPELVAGYSQCVYCDALHRCPECENWIMNLLEATEIIQEQQPEMIVELYDAAKLAAKRKDAIAAWIKDQLSSDPESCPGLRLKPGTTIREIDCDNLFDRLSQEGMVEHFWESISASQSKIKEFVPGPVAKALLKDPEVLREVGTRAPTIVGA